MTASNRDLLSEVREIRAFLEKKRTRRKDLPRMSERLAALAQRIRENESVSMAFLFKDQLAHSPLFHRGHHPKPGPGFFDKLKNLEAIARCKGGVCRGAIAFLNEVEAEIVSHAEFAKEAHKVWHSITRPDLPPEERPLLWHIGEAYRRNG